LRLNRERFNEEEFVSRPKYGGIFLPELDGVAI
jgi:hypothetical protein